jgi:hypothetical protein
MRTAVPHQGVIRIKDELGCIRFEQQRSKFFVLLEFEVEDFIELQKVSV